MAEAMLAAREPFADCLPPGRFGALGGAPGVVIRPMRLAGAVALFGADAARDALDGIGLGVPEPRRWTEAGEWRAFWIGPERWLVLGPADAAQVLAGPATVDQSDARAMLRLGGERARDLLARLVAVDVHPRAFGPGDVAVTQAGHLGCIVWQIDAAPSFGLAVARSYAGSLAHWLIEATAEFGLLVEA